MNLLENQKMAETIDSIYIDLETQLMQNIARHLRDWDKPIDTDIWLMQKLAEIGKLNKENIRIIAQMSGLSLTAAERMLNEAAEEAIQSMEPGFRYLARRGLVEESVDAAKSKNVKQVMNSMRDQAKDSLNLTNTTMLYKAQKSFKTLVQETSKKALEIMNNNTAAVATGASSRQQALRSTIRQFNEQGITGFVDKRGRNWTPEAYVNMCMRNTAKNVADEVQTARCLDHGVSLIEISSHAGARPKCAKDQGKIFDLKNGSGKITDANGREIEYYPWNSSSYGEPDGILGINCHHHKFPFVPGVSIQRYFPTKDFEENDKLYKETQVQRALERNVRKQKRECMLYDTLGDTEAFEDASVKLKSQEAKLKDYVNKHDFLSRRSDREQVVGFDKRISAEAVGSAKKHYAEWAKSIGAETGPATLAGYYDLKYNDNKESRLYKGYITAINNDRLSPLVGYDQFKEVDKKITEELDGLITTSGVVVKGHTAHFVDRLIGTHEVLTETDNKDLKRRLNHAAVTIEEAKQAITNGVPGEIIVDGKGRKSQRFVGKKCIVTFNPDTQELIQTNRR